MSDEGKKYSIKFVFITALSCFFFSGAVGLIYEIVWTRMLSLVFGSTTMAVSVVLSTFMGGLALGSFIFGRIADRISNPLRGYGFLQLGTGLYAVLLPLLMKAVQPLYLSLAMSWDFQGPYYIFLFIISVLLLIIPATLMGGTFPLMSKFYIRKFEAVGEDTGRLYAINSIGAVLGILLSGYILLSVIGMSNINYLAAFINIAIGVFCYFISKDLKTEDVEAADKRTDTSAGYTDGNRRLLILIAFGVSGFTSMVYEVAWTRALVLTLGSSVYALSTMLMTFISGLALGSFLFSKIWKERRVTLFVFGIIEAGIGVSVLILMPQFDRLPVYFVDLFIMFEGQHGLLQFTQFLLSYLVMLFPTILFGASFPAACRISVEDVKILGSRIGQVYSVNTLGCILGSAMTGFMLLPLIGAQWSIKTAALVNILIAVAMFIFSPELPVKLKRISAAIPLVIFLFMVLLAGDWNRKLLNVGPHLFPRSFLNINKIISLEELVSEEELLFYREGINCNVAVFASGKGRSLHLNGKADASTETDMSTQLLSAYLPLILHDNPEEVFVLGLGSGITAGAASNYGVKSVECAEIEKAVIEAAAFFKDANHDVLKSANVKILNVDGRNYLLANDKKYDIITSEPSNPWISGMSSLFTRDYYNICRSRLKEKGLMCQWIPAYNVSPGDIQMIVSTFRSVFPFINIWKSTMTNDLLMLGGFHEIDINPGNIAEKIKRREVRDDFKKINIENEYAFLAMKLLSNNDIDSIARGGRMNSDDLPLLEFSAPRSRYIIRAYENYRLLLRPQKLYYPDSSNIVNSRIHLYRGLHFREFPEILMPELNEAIELDRGYYLNYLERAKLNIRLKRMNDALDDINTAKRLKPDEAGVFSELALLYQIEKKDDEAVREIRNAIRLNPDDIEYRLQLIRLLINKNAFKEAHAESEKAFKLDNKNSQVLENFGFIKYKLGMTYDALEFLKWALERDKWNYKAYLSICSVYYSLKEYDKAINYLVKGLKINPAHVEARLFLGVLYMKIGQKGEAEDQFNRVLLIEPGNKEAREYLQTLDK